MNACAATSHMFKSRISFGSQYKFPLKLSQVVNDETVLKWSHDGKTIVAEQGEFEEKVMQYYPGFVQVKSFHNLRRLFRDYSFKYTVLQRNKTHGLKMEFWHPFFKRGEPNHLMHVRKRRRRYTSSRVSPTPKNVRRRKWAYLHNSMLSNCVTMRSPPLPDVPETDSLTQIAPEHSDSEFGYNDRSKCSLFSFEDPQKKKWDGSAQCTTPLSGQQSKNGVTDDMVTNEETSQVLQLYAKNELSEVEYWEMVTRKYSAQCSDNSWETMAKLLENSVYHELAPLHQRAHYYELTLDQM